MTDKSHDPDNFDWLDSIINEETDKRVKNEGPQKKDQTSDDSDNHWFDSIIDAAVEKRTKENERILHKLKEKKIKISKKVEETH